MMYPPTPPRPESSPYVSPWGTPPPASYGAVQEVPPYGTPPPAAPYPYGAPPYGAAPVWHQPNAYRSFGPGYPGVRGTNHPDDMTLPFYSASFGTAVRRFFKGYVRFRGRASQSEYWWAQLFQVLFGLVVAVLLFVVMMPAAMDLPSSEMERLSGDRAAMMRWMFDTPSIAGVLVVAGVCSLALLLPQLALGWRRLQDANLPGGWTFVAVPLQASSYIPVVGSLFSLGALAWWVVLGTLSTKPEGQRFDRP